MGIDRLIATMPGQGPKFVQRNKLCMSVHHDEIQSPGQMTACPNRDHLPDAGTVTRDAEPLHQVVIASLGQIRSTHSSSTERKHLLLV